VALLPRLGLNGISIAPLYVCSTRFRHFAGYQQRRERMLWTILVILLVLWLIGFLGHIGGGLIHLLLVIALIVFIINLVSGRRAV
jgi:K+-transporting ATPase A subunit